MQCVRYTINTVLVRKLVLVTQLKVQKRQSELLNVIKLLLRFVFSKFMTQEKFVNGTYPNGDNLVSNISLQIVTVPLSETSACHGANRYQILLLLMQL